MDVISVILFSCDEEEKSIQTKKTTIVFKIHKNY